jgi:hypothetical protein
MRPMGALGHSADDLTQNPNRISSPPLGISFSMALTTSPASFKETGLPVSRVPSRERMEFGGVVISGVFAQANRRWRADGDHAMKMDTTKAIEIAPKSIPTQLLRHLDSGIDQSLIPPCRLH